VQDDKCACSRQSFDLNGGSGFIGGFGSARQLCQVMSKQEQAALQEAAAKSKDDDYVTIQPVDNVCADSQTGVSCEPECYAHGRVVGSACADAAAAALGNDVDCSTALRLAIGGNGNYNINGGGFSASLSGSCQVMTPEMQQDLIDKREDADDDDLVCADTITGVSCAPECAADGRQVGDVCGGQDHQNCEIGLKFIHIGGNGFFDLNMRMSAATGECQVMTKEKRDDIAHGIPEDEDVAPEEDEVPELEDGSSHVCANEKTGAACDAECSPDGYDLGQSCRKPSGLGNDVTKCTEKRSKCVVMTETLRDILVQEQETVESGDHESANRALTKAVIV
jgi:hypothetical protein